MTNPFLATERRMLGDIYTSSEVMDNLAVLCDEFGSRFAGTPGERQAVDFFLEKFGEYGLENVHAEEYGYLGWTRGPAGLEVLRPVARELPCISLPYCPAATVEAALVSHDAVLEAAVVGKEDEQRLIKPKAFVVLKPGKQASVEDLQNYVKTKLAPYKYPRWIEFMGELPKTATGKIQRFKLR